MPEARDGVVRVCTCGRRLSRVFHVIDGRFQDHLGHTPIEYGAKCNVCQRRSFVLKQLKPWECGRCARPLTNGYCVECMGNHPDSEFALEQGDLTSPR